MAIASSLLIGFEDSMMVRIAADARSTKAHVRSKSRVGRNDFRMNAKRVHAFQAKLKATLA